MPELAEIEAFAAIQPARFNHRIEHTYSHSTRNCSQPCSCCPCGCAQTRTGAASRTTACRGLRCARVLRCARLVRDSRRFATACLRRPPAARHNPGGDVPMFRRRGGTAAQVESATGGRNVLPGRRSLHCRANFLPGKGSRRTGQRQIEPVRFRYLRRVAAPPPTRRWLSRRRAVQRLPARGRQCRVSRAAKLGPPHSPRRSGLRRSEWLSRRESAFPTPA